MNAKSNTIRCQIATTPEHNRHDSMMLAATLDAVRGVRQGRGRGRPRRRPVKLHADKAYDHRRHAECRARSVTPRIARRGIETSQRLGRHRWVVERTFAWLNQFRRPHSSLGYRPPAPNAVLWPAAPPQPASPATSNVAEKPTMH